MSAKVRSPSGVALSSVLETVAQANRSFPAGAFRDRGQAVALRSGERLAAPDDAALLTVRSMAGEPVYLRDVATIVQAPRGLGCKPSRRRAFAPVVNRLHCFFHAMTTLSSPLRFVSAGHHTVDGGRFRAGSVHDGNALDLGKHRLAGVRGSILGRGK